MRLFKFCLTCLILISFHVDAQAALTRYWEEIAADRLQELTAHFPEGKEVSPALLDFGVDPNIRLFQEAEIIVTYLHERAAFKNSFGYFLYQDLDGDGQVEVSEILGKETIFENVSAESEGGSMRTGDTVHLGKFPKGSRLGFFLVADGFRQGTTAYYSIDDFNPGGQRHLAMLATADREQIVLGIEDLPYEIGDRDFNDLLFTFTTNPKTALQETIEAGNIPIATSKPGSDSQTKIEPSHETPIAAEEESTAPQTAMIPPRLEGSGSGCAVGAGLSSEVRGALVFWYLALVLFGFLSFQWDFHQRIRRQIPRKILASLSVALAQWKK